MVLIGSNPSYSRIMWPDENVEYWLMNNNVFIHLASTIILRNVNTKSITFYFRNTLTSIHHRSDLWNILNIIKDVVIYLSRHFNYLVPNRDRQ